MTPASITKAMPIESIPAFIRNRTPCGDAKGLGGTNKEEILSKQPVITGLSFYEIEFDEPIASALTDLMHSVAATRSVLSTFDLHTCPDNQYLQQVLQTAMALDVVTRYYIKGSSIFNPTGVIGDNAGGVNQPPQRRIRRWMDTPPSERPLDTIPFHQPSLQHFSGSSRNTKTRNLVDFTLCNFRLSLEDIKMLRKGLLSPNCCLEKLKLVNIAFRDDASVHELADAVSELTQCVVPVMTREEGSPMATPKEKVLSEVVVKRCNLSDDQLGHFVRSLMVAAVITPEVESASNADVRTTSSLTHLDISWNRCGRKCLTALGAWLFGSESASNSNRCSCSLEHLNISETQYKSPCTECKRIFSLTHHFRKSKCCENGAGPLDTTLENTGNELLQIGRNQTLKHFVLRGNPGLGDEEMGYLGHLVSVHLVALEELDLEFTGLTDAALAGFAATSCIPPCTTTIADRTEKQTSTEYQQCFRDTNAVKQTNSVSLSGKNLSLQVVRLAGIQLLTSKSSPSITKLLQRYPKLKRITLPYNRERNTSRLWKGTMEEHSIRHLFNVNESGRVLLTPHGDPHHRDLIPLPLWPMVFERINRIYYTSTHMQRSLTAQSGNGIHFLIRNNVPLLMHLSNGGAGAKEMVVATKKQKRSRDNCGE